jgi:drug/metabolite transporter (DMT)-like permease
MLIQLFGALLVTAYLGVFGGWQHAVTLGSRTWTFAIMAGLLNGASSFCLYRAFEVGILSVAAPVSSAYSALTVALALASGERLDAARAVGLAVTFAGLILAAISFTPEADASGTASTTAASSRAHLSAGVGWAIGSAIGFGIMFWWLGFHVVRDVGGPLSVWVVRLTTLLALLLVAVPARQSIRLPRGSVWWLLLAVGVTDTTAFVANNTGMQLGHVSVVTVLSSLYGAVTVLFSAIFVRERIGKSQWFGIALIFAGIVLVNR